MDARPLSAIHEGWAWPGGRGEAPKAYVFATSVNSPDYMDIQGEWILFIKDHLGSPRLLVSADDGEIVQQMDYTDQGATILDTRPGLHPYGFAGGDTNLYGYVLNDPVNWIDPEGLKTFPIFNGNSSMQALVAGGLLGGSIGSMIPGVGSVGGSLVGRQ